MYNYYFIMYHILMPSLFVETWNPFLSILSIHLICLICLICYGAFIFNQFRVNRHFRHINSIYRNLRNTLLLQIFYSDKSFARTFSVTVSRKLLYVLLWWLLNCCEKMSRKVRGFVRILFWQWKTNFCGKDERNQ